MDLNMFEFQLDESKVNNKVGDLNSRVKELRALNNSSNEICKKIAVEFNQSYDQIKKYLLPLDLKRFVGMTDAKLNAVGDDAIKKLKSKYRKHTPVSTSKSVVIKTIIDSYIRAGR